jgi:hypothetical protein
LNKQILHFFLFIIIIVAIQDTFIGKNDVNRIIVIYTQFIAVLLCLAAFLLFFNRKMQFYYNFNYWFLVFLALLTFSAFFSSQPLRYYPRVLYSLLPFFVFFNVAKTGVYLEKTLQYFSIIMVLITVFGLYLGYFNRLDTYGNITNYADNLSYQLLSVMVVIVILKPILLNHLLLGISYLAILFSLKRGAVISASVLILFYFLQHQKHTYQKRKLLERLGSLGLMTIVPYLMFKYSEQFLYRFLIDQTGSGRFYLYTNIINVWQEANLFDKVFGKGFFSIDKGLTYAHSDWFELLHDHGIFGIIIFTGVLVSLFKARKIIKMFYQKQYFLFLGVYSVLFLKSTFSGTYMTKFDALTYGIFGLILGSAYYNKTSVVKLHNEAIQLKSEND